MWFCMLRRLKWTVSAAFLFSLSSSPLFAEQVSATHGQIQPLATSSLLLDIAPVGDALVAVGERGHILLQQPQGWQQVKTPVGSLLTKVFSSMIVSAGRWVMMQRYCIALMVD